MDWLNLHTSVLDSAEFLTAEPVDRATWLCLQRYCCGQENGGRMLGAGTWTDRVWQQLCGVTFKEAHRPSQLWTWEGDDLLVRFYNLETERKVQNNRKVGSAGGHASAEKRRISAMSRTSAPSETQPHASTDSLPHGPAMADQVGERKEMKGKVTEGNEIPPYPQGGGEQGLNGSHRKRNRTTKAGSVLPSDQPGHVAERMEWVGELKGRRRNSPWSAREFQAFREARLHDCDTSDFAEQVDVLGRYYHAKIPADKDYRRRDLQTLLNNWPGELDRARAFKRDNDDGVTKP